ncbi:MAG: hypothetical protein ABFD64_04825 [Armatimonadota bacterium]
MKNILTGLFLLLLCAHAAWGEPAITEKVIKLLSPAIQVSLEPSRPVIVSYKSTSKSGDESCLWGAVDRSEPEVIIYDGKDGSYKSSRSEKGKMEYTVSSSPSVAVYHCSLLWMDKPTVEFELIFSLAGDRLTVTSRLLQELGSFRMSSIKLPLISVTESQTGARLAMPYSSGRLVDVAKASPVEMTHMVDSTNIAPIGMVYHDRMLGLVSLGSPDDNIISKIGIGPKSGELSVEFIKRAKADKPPLIFLVQSDSSCTVTIIEPKGDKPLDWTAGAAIVRDTAPRNINSIYSGSFIYSIMLGSPDGTACMNQSEVIDLIRRVNRITGGAKQVVYLSGWKRLAGDPGIGANYVASLIQQAKLENATVSIADNYSTLEKENPNWDESLIAKDFRGEPAAGLGPGYAISPAKYTKTARERAGKTVNSLGIEKTICLERFSDDPERVDFNPKSPSNRQICLLGKLSIISEFNKLGIDVISNMFTSPFAAKVSYYRRINRNRDSAWSSEERIPLVSMIYHGKVIISDTAATNKDILDLLLNGWAVSAEFGKSTTDAEITDLYYLATLPLSGFTNREITGYERNGSVERVSYDSDNYVEVNKEKSSYRIVQDGTTIASNFSTMMRLSDSRIAVYSRNGGRITMDVPKSWEDAKKMKVSLPDGTEKPSIALKNGKLTIDAAPRTAYRIDYTSR